MALTRISLTSPAVSGTLPVANGGTAVTTAAALANTSNYVFLTSQTVSSAVSYVNFNNVFSSTYDNYFAFFEEVGHDNAGTGVMRCQLGTGSTPTYDTGSNYKYTYIYHQADSSANDTINGGGVGGSLNYVQFGLTNRSSTSNGHIFFTGMNSTTSWAKGINSTYFHHGQNANDFEHAYMSCVYNNTSSAATSIRFYFNAGDVSSGKFKFYGVKA
jgi:hypothetical protein